MKTSLLIITFILCAFLLNGCCNKQPSSSLNAVIKEFKDSTLPLLRRKLDYDSIMLTTAKYLEGGVDGTDAFYDTGFIYLYDNSLFFTQNAADFLDSKKYTNRRKQLQYLACRICL